MAITGIGAENTRTYPVENITALRAVVPQADGQLFEMVGAPIDNGTGRNQKGGVFRYYADLNIADYPDDGGYFIKPGAGTGVLIRQHEPNEFFVDWWITSPDTDFAFAMTRLQACLVKLNLDYPVLVRATGPTYKLASTLNIDVTYADYNFEDCKFIWTTNPAVAVQFSASKDVGPKRVIVSPRTYFRGGIFAGAGGVAKGTNVGFDCTFARGNIAGVNFENVTITGFDRTVSYGSNAYMYSWTGCRFGGGVAIHTKANASNFGENMNYHNCIFGDMYRFMDMDTGGGFYFHNCSFDYSGENDAAVPLFRVSGQINFNSCHFEWGNANRPNSGNSVFRLGGDSTYVVIRDGIILLNDNAATVHDYWFNFGSAGAAAAILDTYVYGARFSKAWGSRDFEMKIKTNGNGNTPNVPANITSKRTEASLLIDPTMNDVTLPDFWTVGEFDGTDATRTRLKSPSRQVVANGDGTVTFVTLAKSNEQPGMLFPVNDLEVPVINFDYKVKHTPANFNAFVTWFWTRVEGDTRGYRVVKRVQATMLGQQTLTQNPDFQSAVPTSAYTFRWPIKPRWATHMEFRINMSQFEAASDGTPNGVTIRNLYHNYFNSSM
ncbi:tail fiber protein [Serratia phage Moabite]|uniref:Tail fiber protein n=1 Tax=Serratia phage Moabite TaxID=2587814 RepID=A0A4Y5TRN0_9CAUD|nr:tail fiber protein [Serratia phage Moabite]QDB71230.1 tail fiber protein [Serratia phage Moabite]